MQTDLLNLAHRCKGASHYGLSADRKRRSQESECTDSTSELTIAALPNDSTNSATVALLSDDPGLVNPAFDPSMEDHNSQSDSTTSLAARSTTKKSECECAQGCLWVVMCSPAWQLCSTECLADWLKINTIEQFLITVRHAASMSKLNVCDPCTCTLTPYSQGTNWTSSTVFVSPNVVDKNPFAAVFSHKSKRLEMRNRESLKEQARILSRYKRRVGKLCWCKCEDLSKILKSLLPPAKPGSSHNCSSLPSPNMTA